MLDSLSMTNNGQHLILGLIDDKEITNKYAISERSTCFIPRNVFEQEIASIAKTEPSISSEL
jgi:hypothetical protein